MFMKFTWQNLSLLFNIVRAVRFHVKYIGYSIGIPYRVIRKFRHKTSRCARELQKSKKGIASLSL